ncbi:MAG: hypothetical protein QE269_00605 [Fimbriimonas sp.]|jgi:hypothetical protein|nr:hypothetical protein [Fimbriimonas sp.]
MQFTVPKASLLPAFLLACVVGVTFGSLRYYGPESTVRMLHTSLKSMYDEQLEGKGIQKWRWSEIRGLMVEDPGDSPTDTRGNPYAMRVISGLYTEFQNSARYSLAKTDRFPREVRIAVVYSHANGQRYPIVYVVEKPVGVREWKLNATKTIQANFLN